MMKTTKRILCLLMALALCLCMVLASCKKEPETPTPCEVHTDADNDGICDVCTSAMPAADVGDKKGQTHETEGMGGGANLNEPNDQVSDDETTRY